MEGAFLPVVAPFSAFPTLKNEYYGSERDLLIALADAMREEYRAIIDAGLTLQIDDAFLPFMYERLVPPMTLDQYRTWAEMRVDALNHALEGIPEDRTRYHIRWGSWNGPHTFDVPLKDIVDLILKVRVGAYLFEAANPRHEHEWKVWQASSEQGACSGRHQPRYECGRASGTGGGAHSQACKNCRTRECDGRDRPRIRTRTIRSSSPSLIQWAKLRALAEGARLATVELWGSKRVASPN